MYFNSTTSGKEQLDAPETAHIEEERPGMRAARGVGRKKGREPQRGREETGGGTAESDAVYLDGDPAREENGVIEENRMLEISVD
jgi:hypothetical protein